MNWTPTKRALPPDNDEVEAMDSGGHLRTLRYDRNLWWFPDYSMYVYFTPKFWRPLEPDNFWCPQNGEECMGCEACAP
jgi:hypothetical protein